MSVMSELSSFGSKSTTSAMASIKIARSPSDGGGSGSDNNKGSFDSGLWFHVLVVSNLFVVLHDIILVFVVAPVVCLALFYRAQRIGIILSHYTQKDRSGDAWAWRSALWMQLFQILVDVPCFLAGVACVLIAPQRSALVWGISRDARMKRYSPCCGGGGGGNAAATAAAAVGGRDNVTGLEMRQDVSSAANTTTNTATTTTTAAAAASTAVHTTATTTLNFNLTFPQWDGRAPRNSPHAIDGYWRLPILSQLVSGIVDFPFLLLGLPSVVTLYRLDKVLRPMLPNDSMNHGRWYARFNLLFQSWRVLVDLVCLPFALVVLVTVCRAVPACAKLATKRSRPCADDPSLQITRLSIEVNGRANVRRSTLRLHMECTPVGRTLADGLAKLRFRVGGESGLWRKCKEVFGRYATDRLRSWFPVSLCDAVNLDVNNLDVDMRRAASARQRRVGTATVTSNNNSRSRSHSRSTGSGAQKDDDHLQVPSLGDNLEASGTAVVDNSNIPLNEIVSFSVSIYLPLGKSDLLSKLESLDFGNGNRLENRLSGCSFQIESGNTNLVCTTLPLRELVLACKRKDAFDVVDTPMVSMADTVVLQQQQSNEDNPMAIPMATASATTTTTITGNSATLNTTGTAIPGVSDVALLQLRRAVAENRGDGIQYHDMRDSFSEIFFLAFLKLCTDVFISLVALLVLCVAPWRFVAMVYRLCEPRRRLPLRIANRFLSRIDDSFALDFDKGRERFILAANEAAKERKRNLDNVRHTKSDGEAALSLYLTHGSDLESSDVYKGAKRRLRRHSNAMERWLSRIEREVRTGPSGSQSLPYLQSLKTDIGLKEAELYYTALNLQLNRARMCGVFPSSEMSQLNHIHDSVPCLVEELRNAHDKFHATVRNASRTLSRAKRQWSEECLHDTRCGEWGAWQKEDGECSSEVGYYLRSGIEDWWYILMHLFLFCTLYRLPSICYDLSTVPGMSTCTAWWYTVNPAGHYRVRRWVVHKHVRGIMSDLMLLCENLILFVAVAVLLVRLPSYLVYLPTTYGLLDLRNYALQCIRESVTDWCGLFGVLILGDTWMVLGRAVAFAGLMPATALATVFDLFFGCCCNRLCQFFSAMLLFLFLAITPLAIVFSEAADGGSILYGVQLFGVGLLVLLLLSSAGTCVRVAKTRTVSKARWSSPQLRLSRCPNVLALLTCPLECLCLLMACLAGFYNSSSAVDHQSMGNVSVVGSGVVHWPSYAEDSDYGTAARTWSYFAMFFSFVWIVVLSVPIGLHSKRGTDERSINMNKLRNTIIRSPFYTNTAASLGGVAFLPMVLGLLLPLSCRNNITTTNNNYTMTNSTSYTMPSNVPGMVCWESGHLVTVALALEFLYVVLLTNVGVNVSEYSEDLVARDATRAKDTGLDLVYASSFTSGIKLLQVLLLFLAAVGATTNYSGTVSKGTLANETMHSLSLLLFLVVAVLMVLFTPLYYVITKYCCSQEQQEGQQQPAAGYNGVIVLSSVPWVPALRSFGFLSVMLVGAVLFLLDTNVLTLSLTTTTTTNSNIWTVDSVLWAVVVGCIVFGIVCAAIVRRCSSGERSRFLTRIGLTKALKDLNRTEALLFRQKGFDAAWQSYSSHDKGRRRDQTAVVQQHLSISDSTSTHLRSRWLKRVPMIQNARGMGQLILEFERHILAENLDEKFISMERPMWKQRLNMDVAMKEYDDEDDLEDDIEGRHTNTKRVVVGHGLNFDPIMHGLRVLRRRLRPPTMTRRIMELVRLRVSATHAVFYKRGIYDGSASWVNNDKSDRDYNYKYNNNDNPSNGRNNKCIFDDGGYYTHKNTSGSSANRMKCSKCGHIFGIRASVNLEPTAPTSAAGSTASTSLLGGAQFVDATTKKELHGKGRRKVLVLPLCDETPPGQVYSTILSFIGAEVLSDLRETPFNWTASQNNHHNNNNNKRSLAKQWRSRVEQHDDSSTGYVYPCDLWCWLHAPTFASKRSRSLGPLGQYSPFYNVEQSRLNDQVECAQMVIAHVAIAVAKLEDDRKRYKHLNSSRSQGRTMNGKTNVETKGETKGEKKGGVGSLSSTAWSGLKNIVKMSANATGLRTSTEDKEATEQEKDKEKALLIPLDKDDPFNKWTCRACTFENVGCPQWKGMDAALLDAVVDELSNCTMCQKKRGYASFWVVKVQKAREEEQKQMQQANAASISKARNTRNARQAMPLSSSSSPSALSLQNQRIQESHFLQLVSHISTTDRNFQRRNNTKLLKTREMLKCVFQDAEHVYRPTSIVEAVGVVVQMRTRENGGSESSGHPVAVAEKVFDV